MVDVSLSALGGAGWQFLDNNGNILSGGRLYTYGAGGTTPVDTYADQTGNVSNGIYVQLDSAGRPSAEIWQELGTNVKFEVKSSTGTSIRTYDYIPGILPTDYGPSYAELASTTDPSGASLIGNLGGGTVQDGIFVKGRQTPIPSSKMAVLWMRDDASFPLENEGGLWSGAVVTQTGLNATFDAGAGASGSPCASLFVMANNNGSPGDVVAGLFDAIARADNTDVFGANIIARGTGKSGCKFVGLEIDIEPSSGDSSIDSGSGALYINIFNKALPGPAIQTGGISGGTFNNGIILGGLSAVAAGVALGSGGEADSLINATIGTFHSAAVTLGDTAARGLLFKKVDDSKRAQLYFDGANVLSVIPDAGYWVFRDAANLNTLVSINETTGDINLEGGGTLYFSNTPITTGASAGLQTLPSNPEGFLSVNIGGTLRKIPFYRN